MRAFLSGMISHELFADRLAQAVEVRIFFRLLKFQKIFEVGVMQSLPEHERERPAFKEEEEPFQKNGVSLHKGELRAGEHVVPGMPLLAVPEIFRCSFQQEEYLASRPFEKFLRIPLKQESGEKVGLRPDLRCRTRGQMGGKLLSAGAEAYLFGAGFCQSEQAFS